MVMDQPAQAIQVELALKYASPDFFLMEYRLVRFWTE